MGRFEKDGKVKSRLPYLIGAGIALALAAVILLVLNLFPREEKPEVLVHDPQSSASTQKEELLPLTLEAVTEEGETVVLRTSYASFKYPYAFSDILQMNVVSEGQERRLEFTARIVDMEAKLFDLCFYSQEGIAAGSLELAGQSVPVSVVIYDPGREVEGESLATYYAAQELLNDIIFSMEKNANFTPLG